MKTGSFKVHPKTTCSDGFLSIHKEVPYPLPYGLTVTTTSKDRCRTLGDLLPEAFMTVTTWTMIKSSNNKDLTPEEHSLLVWIHSHIFKHNDGRTKQSILPIGTILLAGDADCPCLIAFNGCCHLCIFKAVWYSNSDVLFFLSFIFYYSVIPLWLHDVFALYKDVYKCV